MKLVFISDTHGYLRERDIPPGDVLIHCGDATSVGRPSEMHEFLRVMGQIRPRFKHVLFTPGNHDRCIESSPALWLQHFLNAGIQLLIHDPWTIDGIKFFGSPFTRKFSLSSFVWSFGYKAVDGPKFWAEIPVDTDVIFTHGMPYGVLDKVGRLVGNETDTHAGCPALGERVRAIAPRVYAGGHLHLQGGNTVEIGGTIYANAAICDDSYRPLRAPIEVEIKPPATAGGTDPSPRGADLANN